MRLNFTKKSLAVALLLFFFASGISVAQVSIGSLPYTKTDNFNAYTGSSAASLPSGWTTSGATTFRGTGTGTSNSGGFYAFGSGSDYSIGALRSSTATYTYNVSFTNTSGEAITKLTISWNYEQWRYSNTSGWDCTGTGALTSNATLNGKDFAGVASGSSGSVSTTPVSSFTLTGLNIASGQAFGISWSTTDETGADNGVAIDDFSLLAEGAGGPENQTITFAALAGQTYGVAPFALTATATSGLPVAFSSSNTNVATISGSTITIVGAGSANITASQAGDANFNAAPNVVRALSVSPKNISTTGAVADNKTYDRNNAATISGATATGLVNGDVITVTGGGTFADVNAGNAIPVTAALTLSGAKASSYALTQPTGLSADILPKDLNISGASVANKAYDGNNSAILTGTLTGVIAPDEVILLPMVSFESPFVASAVNIISESTLTGADAANYNLVQPLGLTADITPKSLFVTGAVALNKIYDGNTDAIINGTLDGVIAPDEVFFNGVGVFDSPEVGTDIPVTSVSFLTGDVANYVLVQPTGLSATISAEALTPQEITFDALAAVVYGDAAFNLTATASSGLPVSYTSSDETVATVSGGTVAIIGVGTTTITASQAGDGTYDLALPVLQDLAVLPKTLEVTDVVVSNKTYDGNDNATLTGTVIGVVGTDDVSLVSAAHFDSANAGPDQPVTPSFSITGSDINKYTLAQPSDLFGSILPKTLAVSGVTADDKSYDGTDLATLSNINFSGVIGSDEVTLTGGGTFATANAGNDIPVTAALVLGGAQAGNYSFTQPAGLTATIHALPLTISGLAADDKVYDATTSATLNGTAVLNGVLGSEDVSLAGIAVAAFDNKNVGNDKPVSVSGLSLGGSQSDNYTLSAPAGLTASVTAKDVSVSGAVANDKVYDGTTAATLSNTGLLSGSLDGGNVSVSPTAAFESAGIGNNIAVLLSLAGSAAFNYNLIQPGITANITAAPCGSSTVTWNFNTANPSGAAIENLSVPALTQGNNNGTTTLITSVSASNNAGASGGNNAGAAARTGALNLNTSAYFEFKLDAAAGFRATLSGISFGSRETSTGPKAFAVRSSLDNYATDLAGGSLPSNSSWNQYVPALTATTGSPGAVVTYRIYGYNGSGSPSSGTANWRIDDLNLTVSVSAGLSSASSATACSGSAFNYTATSAASGATFSWTRAAVAGISNAAVNDPQEGSIDETLINTTANPVNVVYAFQVVAGTCYTTENVTVTVLPESLGGTVLGSATVCLGSNSTTLTLNGQTGSVVKWQSSTQSDFSSSVTDIANTTATLQVTNLSQTTYYRAVVANAGCASAISTVATISVNEPFPFYVDADGDGFGTGDSVLACADNATTPPTGYALNNTDCDDAIFAVNPGHAEVLYNGVDDNCDGQLDEGFQIKTALLASSCGTTLTSIGSLVGITTVSSAISGYRIKITNGAQVQIIEKNVPHFTFPEFASYDYATTYSVEIELQRQGIWLGYYGPACLVSTPAILEEGGASSVSPSQCGITLPRINTLIATTSLQGVTGYRFRVTNLTDAVGPNAEQTIDRTQNWFSLPMLTRYNYGTTYRIEVAVKTTAGFGGYGAPCEVNSPATPSLINCGGSVAAGTSTVAATSVQGATQYRFQITRASDLASATIDRNTNYFIFNSLPASAFTAGALYYVRVAVMTTGNWSPFGDACEIFAPGAATKGTAAGSEDSAVAAVFNATAYPNPFAAAFHVAVVSSNAASCNIKVYDMLGRLVEHTDMASGTDSKLGDNYPSGVYNVVVTQGETVKTLRVIKR